MNKLKLYNKTFKKVFFIIFIIIFFILYITIFINSNLVNSIINDKYTINKTSIKNDILYSSLNKLININDIEPVGNIVDVIIDEEYQVELNNPIIYIYNTHDTEKYSLPFVSDYSITPDVKLASYILKDHLNDLGIESFVQTKSINDYLKKHNLGYTGCYEASREYMKEEFKNNDYKILIDLHRDSVNHKQTLYEKDNKKYAKIMFVLTTKHKNYKENEKFVNILNDKLNNKYNGLSRGIMKRKDVIFNQDMSNNAILIELGGVDSTLEEINNSLEVLAIILAEYIKEGNYE